MRRLLEFFVERLGDLGLALLCIAAVATFTGKAHWILELLSHFQVYYFAAAILLLIGNIILRRRKAMLVACLLTAVGVFHLAPFFIPQKTNPGSGEVYKVMLLNLNLNNEQTDRVRRSIEAANPDVLILQEVTPRWSEELKTLAKDYKHSALLPKKGTFGLWVLSNFELVDIDIQPREDNTFIHVKYTIGDKPLEIVALHPNAPGSAIDSKNRNIILNDAATYAAGEGSCIAIGDFNCSPWSPYFKSFLKTSGLKDTARGRGIKSTWFPFLVPLGIPIDHVLVSPDIEVLQREVGDNVGSDHRAVIVQFRLGI